MAITVKHSKVSTIPDDADTSLVRPSDWNDDHVLTGTVPVANGGTGAATADDAITNLLPSQTGNNGKFLSTNGTTTTWSVPAGAGDVVGPASSTDNAIARFDSTTGKLLQNSVVTIGDTGAATGFTTLAASTSVTTPTVQATNSSGLALKNSAGTTQISMGSGGGDNVTVSAPIAITPVNGLVNIAPTGTGSVTINPATAGTINNMSIGATTASTGAFTSLTDSGNLTFTGTGNRITGDFSNGTFANRVAFQSSTTNSNTKLTVIPNGTAVTTGLTLFNNSDTANAAYLDIATLAAEMRITSTVSGTGTLSPITFRVSATEALRIDTSGNVGIGTSSLTYKLEVNGTGRFNNSGAGGGTVIFGNNLDSGLGSISAPFNSAVFTIANTTANPIAFNTSGTTERMRIDSSGNVGIGTSAGNTKFTVQGAGAYGIARFTTSDYSDGTAGSGILINTGATTGNTYTSINAYQAGFASSNNIVLQNAGGNVGIGTSSPTALLDVNGNLAITGTARRITGDFSNATIANRVLFQTSTTNGQTRVEAIPSGTANSSFYSTYGNSDPTNASRFALGIPNGSTEARLVSDITGTGTYLPITMYTGGSEKLRIDTSGNLLVGTTTTAGSVSNTANIVGGLFTTHSGTSGTIATGTPTNIITSLVTGGYYLVAVNGATNSTIYSMAYVYFDGGGTGNVTTIASVALTITSGSANAITLTTAGAGQAFSWSITRIK
jgi:hypothetical protein